MSEHDDMRQLVWDFHQAVERRVAAELGKVQSAIDLWMDEAFRGPLPANWRESLHELFLEQEAQGRRILPRSAAQLEQWIEWWAGECGLLPADGEVATAEPSATDQSFVMAFAPNVSGPPESGTAPVAPAGVFVNGVEVAGPGPEVTASYKAKVQQALELLEPNIAEWWKAISTGGRVRARAAAPWQSGYYSAVENKVPVVVVDQNYTAGQTAMALIDDVENHSAAGTIGELYRGYRHGRTGDIEEFQRWQLGSFREAAAYAGTLAEMYYSGLASITTAGDVVVTLNDVLENGLGWQQAILALPLMFSLRSGIKSLTIVIPARGAQQARRIPIPPKLIQDFQSLEFSDQQAIVAEAAAAASRDAAPEIIERGIAARRAVTRVKPAFPPPVAEIRARSRAGQGSPHPSHVRAAQSEEVLAREIHSLPNEVVILWGKPIGANGPDIISYNLKTGVLTLWDDKYRSELRRIARSKTFAKDTSALGKSLEEAERAVQSSNLSAADKSAALNSIKNGTYHTRTRGSGNARNSTFEDHR